MMIVNAWLKQEVGQRVSFEQKAEGVSLYQWLGECISCKVSKEMS